MDITESVFNIIREFSSMDDVGDLLSIFSTALIIIIGIIALIEAIVYSLKSEDSSDKAKKAFTILFYAVILMASGTFWLNFLWQSVTGTVLLYSIPAQNSHCILFICGY